MSALSNLQHHLNHYWQLPYHQDTQLANKLIEVQAWQRARLERTHQTLFKVPKNKPMADYFLNQLYGGDEFKTLAEQLARILPKATKLERLAKESALETASMIIKALVVAIELDLHMAAWLLDEDLLVNETNMLTAYRAVNESDKRREQIDNLKELCYRTDKYLNSFILRKGFGFAKSAAYRHNFQPLYDFIGAGFNAMKPLDSVSKFIEPFCTRELAIIEQIYTKDSNGKSVGFTVS